MSERGDRLRCDVCNLVVDVVDPCACEPACVVYCCEQPMTRVSRAERTAARSAGRTAGRRGAKGGESEATAGTSEAAGREAASGAPREGGTR